MGVVEPERTERMEGVKAEDLFDDDEVLEIEVGITRKYEYGNQGINKTSIWESFTGHVFIKTHLMCKRKINRYPSYDI